jgi:hypothetical protein
MSAAVTATPSSASPPEGGGLLNHLPTIPFKGDRCPVRACQHLDFLLLAIEALDLGGSEAILLIAEELGLKGVIKNRVQLWQLRNTNPMRRNNPRRTLSQDEAKALVEITCYIARRLTVLIRQLLLSEQQIREKNLPIEQDFRLYDYLLRFRSHFRQRMNMKRSSLLPYADDQALNGLAMELLGQLLFCTGTAGAQRLWVSLFDGEI